MLTKGMIDDIVGRIRKHLNPEKIILFGSYACGTAREDSDLDLLIVAETDLLPQDRYPAVRRLLSDYPIGFDIILETPEEYCCHKMVVNHISYFADKYGKIFYERTDAGDCETMAVKSCKRLGNCENLDGQRKLSS